MKLADRIYQLPTQEEQDEAADKVGGVGGVMWGWFGVVGFCGGMCFGNVGGRHPKLTQCQHPPMHRRPRSGIGSSRSSTRPR